MFVAPLNLDLFFKKVFSNKRIAKKFLEDLLGITITEIKLLSVDNKMTDEAVTVKFDFRCKINGHYVVIEMQQKYKIDVVKRFYLYHAVSTALQLETLKPVKVEKLNGETYMEKNYSGIVPVITIIWMVDDRLGFEEDYVAFTTLPEVVKDFITNEALWEQPLELILEERKKTLKILDNKTKGLDFFTQNRLIYILQKNIVKKQNSTLPYFKWFDFANISRNPDNKEEDFLKFKDDKDMAEVINRLRKDKLTSEEFKYISDIQNYDLYVVRLQQDHEEKLARKLASQKKRLEKIAFEHQLMLIEKAEQEKQKAEQEKQKAEQFKIKLAKMLLLQGETTLKISEVLEISIEDTEKLIEKIQNKEV